MIKVGLFLHGTLESFVHLRLLVLLCYTPLHNQTLPYSISLHMKVKIV